MEDLEEELKPCPHGCRDAKPVFTTAMGESWVYCPACKCSSGMQATKESAIDLWNTRSEGLELILEALSTLWESHSHDLMERNNHYLPGLEVALSLLEHLRSRETKKLAKKKETEK